MKKILAIALLGLTIYACKYDYDCYCTQYNVGVGSKSLPNMTRNEAEQQCQSFHLEVIVTDTAAECNIMQTY